MNRMFNLSDFSIAEMKALRAELDEAIAEKEKEGKVAEQLGALDFLNEQAAKLGFDINELMEVHNKRLRGELGVKPAATPAPAAKADNVGKAEAQTAPKAAGKSGATKSRTNTKTAGKASANTVEQPVAPVKATRAKATTGKAAKGAVLTNEDKARIAAEALQERAAAKAAKDRKAAEEGKQTRRPATPKFMNPQNPTELWSGRGRQPRWFADALANGVSEEELAIPA